MTKLYRILALSLSLSPLACDSEESNAGSSTNGATGTPITCEWFAGNNCFKTIAAEAQACVDASSDGGLSGDGLTCSYAGGTVIKFASSPLGADLDDYVWDFDIVNNGTSCASYSELGHDGDGGFSLETQSGEVREEIVGMQMTLVCPSGERYTINAFEAIGCLTSGLPGHAWSNSSNFVSFSFIGAAEQKQLFDCETAE